MVRKIESNVDVHEKEKTNWVKQVSWMNEVQEYDLQNFLIERSMIGLDDKTFYVIKDYIEWRNEAITQGISKIKEFLSGLNDIDDIIQGDLKWFHKQWDKERKNPIAPSEEIIRDLQKKFLEVKEKKMPTKQDLSSIAHMEAMMIINQKHLEIHEENIGELCKEKEVQKQRIAYFGLSHESVIFSFTTAYESWKSTKLVIISMEKSQDLMTPGDAQLEMITIIQFLYFIMLQQLAQLSNY